VVLARASQHDIPAGFWPESLKPIRTGGNVIKIFAAALCITMACSVSSVLAEGFSLDVGGGVLYINKSDNLWGHGKANISSINAKPQSSDRVYPIPAVLLRYRHESLRNTYYLGATHEDYGRLAVGVKHDLDKGAVDAALFYSFMGKEWENPYMLNRTSTNVKSFGLRTGWERIGGGPISLHYTVSAKIVDNDVSGNQNPDLKRDGTTHRLSANYRIQLGETLTFMPFAAYERNFAEGKANRLNVASGGLNLIWKRGNLNWTSRATGHYGVTDSTHPYYGDNRREPGYSLSSILVLKNPLDFKNYFLTCGFIHEQTFSNIPFFEKRSDVTFLLMGYSF